MPQTDLTGAMHGNVDGLGALLAGAGLTGVLFSIGCSAFIGVRLADSNCTLKYIQII